MTIVEPELTLEKGGPAQLRIGQPATFTLSVHNTGSSPAYAVSLTDNLPSTAAGGMCDAAPVNVVVQRYGGLFWTAGPSRRGSGAGW